MSEPPELLEILRRLRPDWSTSDLSEFTYLPGGYSNRNYRFRHGEAHFVLRVPERERAFVDRELEYAFYRSPPRARIPAVVAFEPDTGIMISAWEKGTLLCDLTVDPARVVPYLRDLHGALAPCARSYDPVAAARHYLSVGRPPKALSELAQTLRWAPPETTTCHNDLNPWNVIQDEAGGWITLDWEWLGSNDPVFDLVALHQGLGLADSLLPELVESLLGGAHPANRLRDCVVAFWLREFAWAHAEIHQENDRQEIRDQLRDASARLSAWAGLRLSV